MSVIPFSDISIRPANADDLAAMASLKYQCWQALYTRYLPAELTSQQSQDSVHDDLEKHLNSYLLAWQGERLVGLCGTLMNNIEDLWVHPAHRRQGTATTLVYHIRRSVRNKGYQHIQIGLENFNHPACAMFEKLGWTLIGSQAQQIDNAGHYDALVYSTRAG